MSMSILLPTLVVLAVLIGLFCTYLIKRRNSLMLGALANLTLLVLLIALVQLISLYNNNWFWVVVFSTVIIVVGLAVFLGLTLSLFFLYQRFYRLET